MKRIFALHDSKAEAFTAPIFEVSRGVAIRSFQAEVKNKDSKLCQHAEDFTLYELGGYDEQHAGFQLLASPEVVARAIDFKD